MKLGLHMHIPVKSHEEEFDPSTLQLQAKIRRNDQIQNLQINGLTRIYNFTMITFWEWIQARVTIYAFVASNICLATTTAII